MSVSPELPAAGSRSVPGGTVTFAFTDIEGSTQRWERDRAAMQTAVRRHDDLMRAAIAGHEGHVFKTVGDAFCAAFARPEDAVAAMLSVQRVLDAEDFSAVGGLRVRAAIHTGTADERDGDYFGPAVNRVARLLAIGHGGQVLISGVTAGLVRDALPSQASLRDLGEHRLRDLTRSEHVHQLRAPGLAAEFPALRSLDAHPNNLPLQFNPLIGRETEIEEITALVERHRLVTIVGSGGIGKTRIALQVAANLLDGSGGGVWFIELAPLSNGDYIPATVAHAMGLTLAGEGDPLANLANALRAKKVLLVFDNCELLVEPAGRVISTILRACPDVKALATSRQRLGISAEETYHLPSLGVPKEDEARRIGAREALHFAATALFVERARSADKRFALTDDNAPIVADVCRRLDGIPLAIELAAARIKMLSPRQLRERLNERFRVLTGGSRDVMPRQQTLRALIDWSHDLLDARERALFRRVGIFVNGFTLEGASAVGNGDGLDELDVFDALASLVDKSLVLAEPEADGSRYRLLESTRLYALEKLDAAGERQAVAGKHLRYLRDRFAELRLSAERTGREIEVDQALQTELEDVRSALDGVEEMSGAGLIDGAELLAYIGSVWKALGLDPEGVTRCERYLAKLPPHESRLLALTSLALSGLLSAASLKTRALQVSAEAVAYARASSDGAVLAPALVMYARMACLQYKLDEAQAALTEAEGIPAATALARLKSLGARALLSSFRSDSDMETAARLYEQLRNESRSHGNQEMDHCAALNLAETDHALGRTERAIAIVRETLPALRSGTAKASFANALQNLAGYLIAVDDLPGAVCAAREAMELNATSDPGCVPIAIEIEHLALVFALRGDLARAAALGAYADAVLAMHGFEREFTERTTRERLDALLREQLAPDELERLTAEGAALAPEAAVALALETT
jgi:predicted ATPase/class 3 adenylate cyclase